MPILDPLLLFKRFFVQPGRMSHVAIEGIFFILFCFQNFICFFCRDFNLIILKVFNDIFETSYFLYFVFELIHLKIIIQIRKNLLWLFRKIFFYNCHKIFCHSKLIVKLFARKFFISFYWNPFHHSIYEAPQYTSSSEVKVIPLRALNPIFSKFKIDWL